MDVAPWIWEVTIGATIVFFIFDVWHMRRNPHEPSMKECLVALSFYVGAAIVFGLGVWYFAGAQYGGEFFAGWLTEYSLSIDNLFIFIIIMGKFAVPREYQQNALMIGIILALIMRGIFIAVGAAAINQFSWVFYLFGAFLVLTAVNLAREGMEEEQGYDEPRLVRTFERQDPRARILGRHEVRAARPAGQLALGRLVLEGNRHVRHPVILTGQSDRLSPT